MNCSRRRSKNPATACTLQELLIRLNRKKNFEAEYDGKKYTGQHGIPRWNKCLQIPNMLKSFIVKNGPWKTPAGVCLRNSEFMQLCGQFKYKRAWYKRKTEKVCICTYYKKNFKAYDYIPRSRHSNSDERV